MSVIRKVVAGLFCGLCNIALMMSVSYIMNNEYSNLPYALTADHFELTPQGQLSSDIYEIILKYDKISAIAETDDPKLIGLYDPDMYYCVAASKYVNAQSFRYFSKQDYLNKTDVCIVIDSLNMLQQTGGVKLSAYEEFEKAYNVKPINVFDYNSAIATNSECRVVSNFFAVDLSKVTKICFDSHYPGQMSALKNDLRKSDILGNIGCTHIDYSLWEVLGNAFSGKGFIKLIAASALTVYILLIYMAATYFLDKNKLYVSMVVGSTPGRIIVRGITSVIVPMAAVQAISGVIAYEYIKYIGTNLLRVSDCIWLQAFLLVSLSLVVLIKYTWINIKLKKIMR